MIVQLVWGVQTCNNESPSQGVEKGRLDMAVIVKGEITITKGFEHWKNMVFSQKEKMAEMGMDSCLPAPRKMTLQNYTPL